MSRLLATRFLSVAPTPEVVERTTLPSFLEGGVGLAILAGLVLVAVALIVVAIAALAPRPSHLDEALAAYSDDDDDLGGAGPGDRSTARSFVSLAFLRRAVSTTERLADTKGLLSWLELRLEQAAIPLRAAEALFFTAILVVVAGVLGALLGGPLTGAVVFVAAAAAPFAILNVLSRKRQRAFTSQLPDALQLLASSLRAGYSLMQGVEAVSVEVADPLGAELRRVVAEARLGRAVELALEDSVARIESIDYEWAVMAINIQREVGGNLAEILTTVSETMVSRERLRREVKALTAEGRISAIVLGIMPIGLGAFITVANPGYLDPLFQTSLGKSLLIGSIGLALAGFLWMKKMIEVDV